MELTRNIEPLGLDLRPFSPTLSRDLAPDTREEKYRGVDVTELTQTWMDSPIGVLHLVASSTHLLSLSMEEKKHPVTWLQQAAVYPSDRSAIGPHLILDQAEKELKEYFSGKRKIFSVPLFARGTAFQNQVWAALQLISYGETRSYQDIANHIRKEKAVRAVGLANGRNPISILIPCHRVIGKNGSLTGFGGGLGRKEFLLKHEAKY